MTAIFSGTSQVHAEELTTKTNELTTDSQIQKIFKLSSTSFREEPITPVLAIREKPIPVVAEVKPPAPVEYTVVDGDYLDKIAKANNTTWIRLWEKNSNIEHPDRINVGDKLIIPTAEEVLAPRELPVVVTQPVVVEPQVAQPSTRSAPATPRQSAPVAQSRPSANYDGSNTYDYGYCTWYVKNMRGSSLPNGLGNANTWYSRAAAMGMSVSSTPTVGAVGTTTRGSLGHVVYVTGVNGNGTVNISEMNYKGFGVISTRTTAASEFMYIR